LNPTYPKWISIIGCGGLGSALAYMIMIRSLEKDLDIKQLCLIDYDTLEYKNLPYLHSNKTEYVFMPKVIVLRDILSNMTNDIDIRSYFGNYPDLKNLDEVDINEVYDTYMIDCRDTSSECSACSIKLNLDGPFGVVNLKPDDIEGAKSSRYTINSSRYYSMLFAGMCCQIIFNDITLEDKKMVVDLRKGEFYGITSCV